jgi:hypothetical protein
MLSRFRGLIFKEIAAIGLLAMVLSACSTAAAPSSVTTPEASSGVLVARSSTIDLGRVPFDVQAEGRFDLVNSGSQPVRLVSAPQVKMLEGC